MKAKTLERAFSLERLALLLRNRILDEAPAVGIGAAVILANNLLSLWGSHVAMFNGWSLGGRAWIATIVVGGLLLAGGAFKGMHDGKAGSEWLLLPATPLEKYAAALADSVLVFPIAAALLCSAMSAILELLGRALGGTGGQIWLPLGPGVLVAWANYAVAAAVLIAGSACFRKFPLLKTVGVASAFILAMACLAALGVALLGGGSVTADGGSFSLNLGNRTIGGERHISDRAHALLSTLFDVARYAILPAFAVLFGASKVIEKEGRDEVQ